nr:hypothetical protein [Cytophagales bacterium]
MNKMLLICVGLLLSPILIFGQNSFEVPDAFGFSITLPFLLPRYESNLERSGSDREGLDDLAFVQRYEKILSFGTVHSLPLERIESNVSKGSTMPIVDLSKGYVSHLPIKDLSVGFSSNMKTTELKQPHKERLLLK